MEEKSHQKNLTNVTGSFEVILQKIRQQFRHYVGDNAGLDKQLGKFLYSNYHHHNNYHYKHASSSITRSSSTTTITTA